MENTTYIVLATSAVSFIASEIVKGTFKEAGKDIYETIKRLLKPDEIIMLNLLEQRPNDEDLQNKLASKLEEHLKEFPEKSEELEGLLKKLQILYEKQNIITQSGRSNVSVQDVSGSIITINR